MKCSNCKNCEFVVDKWDQGQIIGSYDACKLDNSIITDEERLINCESFEKKEIRKFIFEIGKEELKCPF